jgi:hypothetical protein
LEFLFLVGFLVLLFVAAVEHRTVGRAFHRFAFVVIIARTEIARQATDENLGEKTSFHGELKTKFYLSDIGDLVHRFPVEGFVRFGDTREIVECGFVDRLVELHSAAMRLGVQIDEQSFADFLIARLNQIAETCGGVTLK